MSRRAAALVVGAAATLAVLALLWWTTAGRRPAEAPPAQEVPAAEAAVETTAAEIYFPNTGGWLGAESREMPVARSAEERAAQVVAALLEGPTEPGNLAPLGDGVELASLHLSGEGVAYVDLAAQLPAPPVSGTRGELLVVYSFVNSILANVPQASGVVLMWNGNQRPTFAGHIDTTRPLPLETKWLARR